jgi:hypothetical protein
MPQRRHASSAPLSAVDAMPGAAPPLFIMALCAAPPDAPPPPHQMPPRCRCPLLLPHYAPLASASARPPVFVSMPRRHYCFHYFITLHHYLFHGLCATIEPLMLIRQMPSPPTPTLLPLRHYAIIFIDSLPDYVFHCFIDID